VVKRRRSSNARASSLQSPGVSEKGASGRPRAFSEETTDATTTPSKDNYTTPRREKRQQRESVVNVAEIARKWELNLWDVKAIVAGFEAADNGAGRVSLEGLRSVFEKTDWGARVPEDVVYSAWDAMQSAVDSLAGAEPPRRGLGSRIIPRNNSASPPRSAMVPWKPTLEPFIEWYRMNMFGSISMANQSERESLIYDLADKHQVTPQTIDNVRKRFDEFDTDGSGQIDYDEFVVMMCKLLRVKDVSQISAPRLQRFWREADVDGSGEIDFEEFCNWYLKNFNTDGEQSHPASVDQGIIGKFYTSFQPSVARRNSINADEAALELLVA
jgi:hypothetical protein